MGLERLKRQADALAAQGARLAAERDTHARTSVALAGKALSSPGALAVLFAAGFVLAAPRTRPRAPAGDGSDADQAESRVGRWLAGPVGTVALKAAFSLLAGAAGPARGVPPVN